MAEKWTGKEKRRERERERTGKRQWRSEEVKEKVIKNNEQYNKLREVTVRESCIL